MIAVKKSKMTDEYSKLDYVRFEMGDWWADVYENHIELYGPGCESDNEHMIIDSADIETVLTVLKAAGG